MQPESNQGAAPLHATAGRHLLCEFSGCDATTLGSVEAVRAAMEEASRRANVRVLNAFYHRFTPTGVSGILCIAESHISVHTWPELGYAAVDIYTCGDHTMPQSAADALAQALRSTHWHLIEVCRGQATPGGTYAALLGGTGTGAGGTDSPCDRQRCFVDATDDKQAHTYAVRRWFADVRTRIHHVEICDTASFGRLLALDGVIQSSASDEHLYHESLVHPAMLAHAQPGRVLILGGGEGATLREVLRHPSVRHATMIDIDGELVDLCRRHLPEWSAGAFDDPRAEVVIADGRQWVEDARERFDVAIMDLTDQVDLGPSFPLYTQAFFRRLRERLSPGGVLVVQAGELGVTEYFSHSTILKTLASVFPHTASYAQYVPSFGAEWSFVLASTAPVDLPAAVIDQRLQQRFGRTLDHYDGAAQQRMRALAGQTDRLVRGAGIVNTDVDAFRRARTAVAAAGAAQG